MIKKNIQTSFKWAILYRKPVFICRVILYFFKKKILSIGDNLTGVNFASHYKCNLQCTHCYERNFHKSIQGQLTLKEKKKIIRLLLRHGVLNFSFIGGEATIDPDLPELIQACQPYKTYISIASNGFQLDEEKIIFYKNCGVDKFCFSLDSMDSDEHDLTRGKKGVHASVLKNIDICLKNGLDVSLQAVVAKDFFRSRSISDLVKFAEKKKIRLQFKPLIPIGAAQGKIDSIITQTDSDIMLKYHQHNPMLIRDSYGGCPAFQNTITITPTGEVLPCNGIHISFGNITKVPLETILKRGRKIPYFNGEYDGCPPAEDLAFIQKYILQIEENTIASWEKFINS